MLFPFYSQQNEQLPFVVTSLIIFVVIIYIILISFLLKHFLSRSLVKEKTYNEKLKKLKKIRKKEKTLKYSHSLVTINEQTGPQSRVNSNESATIVNNSNEKLYKKNLKYSSDNILINSKKKNHSKSNHDKSVHDNKKFLFSIV